MENYYFSIFYFITLFKSITFSQIKSPLHFVFLCNALFLYWQIALNAKMKFPTLWLLLYFAEFFLGFRDWLPTKCQKRAEKGCRFSLGNVYYHSTLLLIFMVGRSLVARAWQVWPFHLQSLTWAVMCLKVVVAWRVWPFGWLYLQM